MLLETHAVPVVHEPVDGVVTARLAFGVGSCDEPVTLAGITHLVEHLAIRAALPIAAHHNATTHDHVTVFEVVTTTVDDALAVLDRLATAISGLRSVTIDSIDHERKVLEHEDGLRYHEQVPSIHTHRFGPTGPGRSGAGAAAVAGITAEEVQRWVSERFVAENALVTVTGGPGAPASVHLDLASGSAAGAISPWTGPVQGRVLAASPLSGTAVSVLVPADVALLLDAVLEDELFAELRVDAGLAYSVEGHVLDVDRDRSVVAVAADTDEDDTVAATDRILATLHRIAAEGPSPSVVAKVDVARALNQLDASARADRVVSEAMTARLRGLQHPGAFDAPVSAVETAALRSALSDAMDTVVVAVDQDTEADLDELARRHGLQYRSAVPGRAPTAGRNRVTGPGSYRDALLPGMASCHARVTDQELVLSPRDEEARVVDLRRAAVVGMRGDRGENGLTIVDEDGGALQVRTDEWWRGRRMVDAILAATPPHLVRRFAD